MHGAAGNWTKVGLIRFDSNFARAILGNEDSMDDCRSVIYMLPRADEKGLRAGWKRPACILDLHAEFKNIWNGLSILAKDQRRTQLNALVQYGIIDHQNLTTEKASKDRSRDLILAGDLERLGHKQATLDYCAGDVDDLDRPDKLRQGEALARTGRSKEADRERGFDACMRGEPGKKAERRVESQRIDSVGKVGGKDRRSRNRFGFDDPACRRTGRDRRGVRLRETGAGNN